MYFHVIMPVGADPEADTKQEIIKKISESMKIFAHFPSYLKNKPFFDINSTIKDINGSAFVLADLSLERPSCYYELGLAETLRKTTFLIAKNGTNIHQSAGRENVKFYNDKNDFKKLIKFILGQAINSF
jgi:hypothetical protein